MTPKEYLSQIGILNRRIEIKMRQLEDARSKLIPSGGMNLAEGRVKSSPDPDPVGNGIIRYRLLELKVNALIDRYIDLRDTITDQINGMENEKYIQLLSLRYIDGMRIRDIAEKMHYEYTYICVLHGKALDAFARQYPEIVTSK